jgi:hypothetical protein
MNPQVFLLPENERPKSNEGTKDEEGNSISVTLAQDLDPLNLT